MASTTTNPPAAEFAAQTQEAHGAPPAATGPADGRAATAPWKLEPNYHKKMSLLCEEFYSLRGAPGTSPWNQRRFAKWLAGPAPSHGQLLAGLFVLSVWNNNNGFGEPPWWSEEFGLGIFDVCLAFCVWDQSHKDAFIAWCEDPFYP